MYHDEFLFHDGAMSSQAIQSIVEKWESRGLNLRMTIDGVEHWHELCCVDMLTGITLPCTWAEYDRQKSCVHMVGKPHSPIIGR